MEKGMGFCSLMREATVRNRTLAFIIVITISACMIGTSLALLSAAAAPAPEHHIASLGALLNPASSSQQSASNPHHTIPSSDVTVTGPADVSNCDIVTYTIVATNDSVTTTNVIITSTMPTGFIPTRRVFDVGTVAPNEVVTRYAVFSATCFAVSGQNVVTLTQDGAAPIVKYTDFTVRPGAIVLRKEPPVIQAAVSDVVEWTVYVENSGYGRVSNVIVTDTLGSGLQYVDGAISAFYASIPVGETRSFTISARVVACSGLDNNVVATWGCPGHTCQAQTTGGSIDLEVKEPLLDYTPPSINIDYCTGRDTFYMNITNIGDGVAYTPTIEVNFSPLVVVASSNPYNGEAFHLPDIAPFDSHLLTFTLSLPTPACGMGSNSGILFYKPLCYDACGNPFYPPVRTGSWNISGATPSLKVSKSGPDEFRDETYADEIITYTLYVTATNFSPGTTIYITDTFRPGCIGYTSLNAAGGVVITDTSGNVTITWSTTNYNWNTQISFKPATSCPEVCDCCGKLVHNTLEAGASDCQTCTVTVSTTEVTAIQCDEFITSYVKYEGSLNTDEACTTRIFTNTYRFPTVFTNTPTWHGMIFTDAMTNLTYITDSAHIRVTNGVQTCAATFTIKDTDPLVIGNIQPSCGVDVPGATMVITYLAMLKDNFTCVSDSFYDWSYLNLGVTGNSAVCPGGLCDDGIFEEGVWVEVVEPSMNVNISGMPDMVSACGIYTPLITLSREDTRAYDVRLRFPITNYVPVKVLGFDGAMPVITHTGTTSWTWEYDDAFLTAPTATVRLLVQRYCTATGPIEATVYYDDLCADDMIYNDTCSADADRSPLVSYPHLILYKLPEIIYAADDVVTWTLTAINSGAGPAYSVTLTDALGSDLHYLRSTITSTMGSATGVTSLTSSHLVTWSDLTIEPGEKYTIKYVAEIAGCDDLINEFAGIQRCQGQACLEEGPEGSHVELPPTLMLSTNGTRTPVETCSTRTITATVRNAGLLSVYDVTVTETLPSSLSYIAGSTEYVIGTGTTPPTTGWVSGGEPSGAPGGPLVWTTAEIPPLARLYPQHTLWVRFDVYADCDFDGGPITIQTDYKDVCGASQVTIPSEFVVTVQAPHVTVSKHGRNLTTGSEWGRRVDAEPGHTVEWRLTLDNNSDTAAQLTVVTDELPSNVTLVAVSPTPDYQSGGVITWNVGTLDQTGWTALITTTVNSGGCTSTDERDNLITTWGCPDTGCRKQASIYARLRTRPAFWTSRIAKTDTLHQCGAPLTITLHNYGPPAYNVTLTDTLPTGYVYDKAGSISTVPGSAPAPGDNPAVWTWNTLPTGVTTIVFWVRNGTGGGCQTPSGSNGIVLTYNDSCGNTYTAQRDVLMTFLVPDLQVTKTPETFISDVGETVTWDITVRNAGSGIAPNVFVTDEVGSGFSNVQASNGSGGGTPTIVGNTVTWTPPFTLGIGQVWTAQVTATVTAAGAHTNVVTATGTCAAGCTYVAADDMAHVTLLGALAKGPEIQTGTIGSSVVFTFTVSLPDEDAIYKDLTLTDTLPVGLGYVSSVITYTYDGDGNQGGPSTLISTTPTITPGWGVSGDIVWSLGDLVGTVRVDGVITVIVQDIDDNDDGDILTNYVKIAYMDDSQAYEAQDIAKAYIEVPALEVYKSVTPTNVGRGDIITYTVIVRNVGSGLARNVDVSDTLPSPGFEYVNGSARLNGVPISDPSGAPGPNLFFDISYELSGHTALTLTFQVRVTDGVILGTRTNTALATGEDEEGNPIPADNRDHVPDDSDLDDRDTADVTIHPEVEITKSAAPQRVAPGSTITFTLLVKNWGDVLLDPVTVSDTLAAGLAYADHATVGGALKEPDSQIGRTMLWNNVGPLSARGGNITITFQAKITAETFTVLTNTAYVIGITPSSGVVTDSDSIEVMPPLPVPVGGVTVLASKVELPAQWVGLVALIGLLLSGTVVLTRRRAY